MAGVVGVVGVAGVAGVDGVAGVAGVDDAAGVGGWTYRTPERLFSILHISKILFTYSTMPCNFLIVCSIRILLSLPSLSFSSDFHMF